MDGQGLRMCRFTRDGIPELGEYLESVDGTGICKLTELDGGGEEVVVCLPDGTMPEGISDLELVRVPTRIEEGDAKTETMSDETAERMARSCRPTPRSNARSRARESRATRRSRCSNDTAGPWA